MEMLLKLYGLTLIASLLLGIINAVIGLKCHKKENQYYSIGFLGIYLSLVILYPDIYPGSRSPFITFFGFCLLAVCIFLLGQTYYVTVRKKGGR